MEKLWLDENNETEFVFNKDKLKDIEEKIAVNKQIIDEYQKKYGSKIIDKIEKDQSVLNVVTAVGLEDENAREKFPPVSENIESQEKVTARGFLRAQETMLSMLNRGREISDELIKWVHQDVEWYNEDISRAEKVDFRTKVVQNGRGYFSPTDPSKIQEELRVALFKYLYKDGDIAINTFERIAKLHAQMVRIQPFANGNKRTAFIVTNGCLKLCGLPIIGLTNNSEEIKEYHKALYEDAIVGRDITPLAELFANKVYAKQEGIINAITVEEVTKELTIVPEKIK